jgi:hypothetical protein
VNASALCGTSHEARRLVAAAVAARERRAPRREAMAERRKVEKVDRVTHIVRADAAESAF